VARDRVLAWDGCLNVRDLGRFATEDGRETCFGRVVRADNVRTLTEAGWQAAVRHGVRTVLDLRLAREREEDPPADPPVDVVHVSLFGDPDEAAWAEIERRAAAAATPAAGKAGVSPPLPPPSPAQFAEALTAVADARPGGVLVHCVGGKDRTGLVAALLLRLARVSVADIAADYALSEGFLAPRNERWLAEATDDAERDRIRRISATPAEAMQHVLEELERRHGSVAAYLADGRVDDGTLARARARLLD
jgi:protein-tyrosine phosphatase